MIETIKWFEADKVGVDDETTVLLITPGIAEGAWPGYKDAGDWYFVDGTRIAPNSVTLWAHLPTGKADQVKSTARQTELPIDSERFSYSIDEERYQGDFCSPEDAAEEAFYSNPDIDSIWVGKNIYKTAHDFVNPRRIIEAAQELAFDDYNELVETWLDELLKNKEKTAELKQLVGDWIQSNEPIDCFGVEKEHEISRLDWDAGVV